MIVDFDNCWAICTPTKCGTCSLEATLLRRMAVAYSLPPRHSFETCPATERLMIVRHPLKRFMSMYTYCTTEAKNSWMREPEDFIEWVEEFFRRVKHKPYPQWTHRLSQIADVYQPHKIFKLEDGLQKVIDYLCETYGYAAMKVSHTNRTRVHYDNFHLLNSLRLRRRDLYEILQIHTLPDLTKFNFLENL